MTPNGMLRRATGFTAMANSDMDGGVPSDLRAQVRQVSEGSAGRGVGAPGAAGSVLPGGPPARRNTDMRAAMNTILHLFPVALHAVRPLPLRSTVYNIFRKCQHSGIWEVIWAVSAHGGARWMAGRRARRKQYSTANQSNPPKRDGKDDQAGYDPARR